MPNGEVDVEPYKLSELFSLIPEYDGNPIFLTTFINSCNTALQIAVQNQKVFLILHIKNKLRGKAAELVNSRNPNTWDAIKNLLDTHFGDARDLTSLIQDLQRIKQLNGESALTFVNRLQSHESKMFAAINKQLMTAEQKQAQTQLVETMVLNTLLTGLEPKLGQAIRAGNPLDMLSAINRIRRELQLNYFESQKFPKNNIPNQQKKTPTPVKVCNFCKRTGHFQNECRLRQNNSNFHRPSLQPNSQQNFQSSSQQNIQFRPNFPNSQISRPMPQSPPQQSIQRPPVIRPNPNFQRPSVIQQKRTHHFNSDNFSPELNDNPENFETYDNSHEFYEESAYNLQEQFSDQDQIPENDNFENFENLNENFQMLSVQDKPPDTNSIQTMNTDNFDPNLNFAEQNFV